MHTLMRELSVHAINNLISMIKSSPGCSSLMRGRLAFANKKKADGDRFGAPSFCKNCEKAWDGSCYMSIIVSERLVQTFCFILFVAILQGPWYAAFCRLKDRFSTSDKSLKYFLWSVGRAFHAREHSFDTDDMSNFNGFGADKGEESIRIMSAHQMCR